MRVGNAYYNPSQVVSMSENREPVRKPNDDGFKFFSTVTVKMSDGSSFTVHGTLDQILEMAGKSSA